MAQEFLIASGIVALQARGFNAIFAGMDRMRGAMGGVDAAHERMRDIQGSALEAMADRQRRLDDRVAGIRDAADRADEARVARHRQRTFDLYAQMEGAGPDKADQLRRRIAAVHERADADQAAAAARLAARLQQVHQGTAVAETAAAKQVAGGMTEATEAAAAAEAALPIAGFLAVVTVIAAVAAALYKLGEAFLQVRDAEIELGIALKIEGQDAAGASEKLQAHARTLAEFANISRRSILDMEAQTLRLGISAEQAGRAVDIAVGLAKAKHTSIEEALHAVDQAIMGREEQLRRMLVEKRGGALTGDALLARATEVGQQGLEFRHTAALTTYEGAVELLSRRWEELRQTIGEAFGPAIMFYIKGFTASFEFLTGMIKDMAEGFRILGDWISETFIQPLDDIFGLSDAFQGMMDLFMNGWDGFKIQVEYIWTAIVNYSTVALLQMEDSFNSFLQATSFGVLGWAGDNSDAITALVGDTASAYQEMIDKLARRHSTEEWDTGVPLRQERSLATASTFDAVSLAKKIQETAFATADPHLVEQKKTNDWLEVIANGVTTGGWGPRVGGAVVGNW